MYVFAGVVCAVLGCLFWLFLPPQPDEANPSGAVEEILESQERAEKLGDLDLDVFVEELEKQVMGFEWQSCEMSLGALNWGDSFKDDRLRIEGASVMPYYFFHHV